MTYHRRNNAAFLAARRGGKTAMLAEYLKARGFTVMELTPEQAAQLVEIRVRVLNETDTGLLVTQSEIGERNKTWVDKAQVEILDPHAFQWKQARMTRGYATKKGLLPKVASA